MSPSTPAEPIAIHVSGLSKAYRIGALKEKQDTLLATLASWIKSPARKLKALKSLNTYAPDSHDPNILWALKNINLEIKKGEVFGIIGHNGAGKSTLLKVLSRITDPTHGSIKINGRVASLLEVGTGFHPELTGRENIYLNGTILGMRKREIDDKLGAIIAFSDIERFIDTPIKRYSSGMKVRLAFAVAAHLDPEILIIDEVLAVGDARFQEKCMGKMDAVARSGRTVIVVSHQMDMIERLCNRVATMKHGTLQSIGPSHEIIAHYLQSFREDSEAADADFESRRQSQRFALRSCQIINPNAHIPMGDSIQIELKLSVFQESEFHPSLYLVNKHGQLVNGGSSLHDGARPLLKPGDYCLHCTLEHPVVAPGDYFIHYKGHSGLEVVEEIPAATRVKIGQSNYLGNGHFPQGALSYSKLPVKEHLDT